MSKIITSNKDLMLELADDFKIQYNKITGCFASGDLPLVKEEKYFYFRATPDQEVLTVAGAGLSNDMCGNDADFLASLITVASLHWSSDNDDLGDCTHEMEQAMLNRPAILKFFGITN